MTGRYAVPLRRRGIVDARASWGAASTAPTDYCCWCAGGEIFKSPTLSGKSGGMGQPPRCLRFAVERRLVALGGSETILGLGSLLYGAKKRRRAMRYESWTATSPDGKIVRFAYKELSDGVAGISAKTAGRFVMILQRSIRAPLTRKE